MTGRTRRAQRERRIISAKRLDRYLTAQLQKLPGFAEVTVSAGYRLCEPDADGCNWSGEVVPVHGVRAPPAQEIVARLQPIVRAARARYNMSE